jgi:hypothetical protein
LLSAPISFGFPVLFYLGALARLDGIGRNQIGGGSECFCGPFPCSMLVELLVQLLVSITCFNACSITCPITCSITCFNYLFIACFTTCFNIRVQYCWPFSTTCRSIEGLTCVPFYSF